MLHRTFSFLRVTRRIPSRTKLEQKLEKANIKEFLRQQNLLGKLWYYLHTHKKKNIFFGCLAGLAYHFDLHMTAYHWFTAVTPLQRVQRGIMKRKINLNARFCREPLSTLKPEVHAALVDFFIEKDRELATGLQRGILVDIALDMNWADPLDKYLGAFLWDSGHRETENQRSSSMRVDQFLGFFEKMCEKTQQDEEVLLASFLQKMPEKIAEAKEKVLRKKQEEAKMVANLVKEASKVFETLPKPTNPEVEDLEKECEVLLANYSTLATQQPKTAKDHATMKEIEKQFILKQAARSKSYS